MVSRNSSEPVRRAGVAGLSTVLTAGALPAALALSVAVSPTAGAAASTTEGGCRVVRLPQADGFADGSVIDIERVGDQVVYYGNGYRFDKRGDEHQRAFVGRGRNVEPFRVGPRGYDMDIALELTATGLVNGSSENFDGTSAQWVQDLATGQITFFDEDSGPRGEDQGWTFVRRINDSGAAVGGAAKSNDPDSWQTDAIGFDSPTSDLEILPDSAAAFDAVALGINNAGDRAGYVAHEFHPEDDQFLVFEPRIWRADGAVDELALPNAIDASVRNIKDDGSVSGEMSWGDHPSTAHIEAAYWPTPDENVGLGVLPGGGFSVPFGMDEGGVLVGLMDRAVPRRNRFERDGFIDHGFFWTPQVGEGAVRILPSLYGAKHGSGWRTWTTGHAVHAVNGPLDQAGASTHWKFRGDRLLYAPTVWLNASGCGVVRPTTHDPFGLGHGSADRYRLSPHRGVGAWKHALADRHRQE